MLEVSLEVLLIGFNRLFSLDQVTEFNNVDLTNFSEVPALVMAKWSAGINDLYQNNEDFQNCMSPFDKFGYDYTNAENNGRCDVCFPRIVRPRGIPPSRAVRDWLAKGHAHARDAMCYLPALRAPCAALVSSVTLPSPDAAH